MKNKLDFIITGLPRTRKAWLANYLTYGPTFCQFEAFRYGPDKVIYPDGHYMSVGASDTSAALYQDRIAKDNPGIKWVLIDRPYTEVSESVKALGFHGGQGIHDLSVKLAELRSKFSPLVVPFQEVNEAVKDILEYLEKPKMPVDRHNMLVEMNITAHKPKVYDYNDQIEPATFSPKNQEYIKLLWDICQPEVMAHQWLKQVIETALVWDHIIDQDAIDFTMTDRVFKALLTEWALNPFWNTNSRSLLPVLSSSISNWQCSYLNGVSKDKAYSIYEDVPAAVAFILGGQARVDSIMPKLRTLVHALRKEDDLRDGGKR